VKANLHVAFTASPVGEAFRVRSQRFLATINSTVIDWFQPWPEVSLLSVARKFLDDVDLESDAVRNTVIEFMPFSFAGVNKVWLHNSQVLTSIGTRVPLVFPCLLGGHASNQDSN
jgi:dynein heavy chain, axonemal